jgi:hypothetical protein
MQKEKGKMRKYLSLAVLSILLISMMVFKGNVLPVHAATDDVGVMSVVATLEGKNITVIYQGWTASVNVTIFDNGTEPETVNVTLYYNMSSGFVGSQNVTVSSGGTNSTIFMWDTTGVLYHQNYTMMATANITAYDPSPGDNVGYENITVTGLGDINGDGKVSGDDLIIAAAAFGSYGPNLLYSGSPASPRWNPLADVMGRGRIDGYDAVELAKDFGKGFSFS